MYRMFYAASGHLAVLQRGTLERKDGPYNVKALLLTKNSEF